ncbi:Laminin beta 1 [Paragonimus heterotremus]|uniref:Laminin beta 1 n=1 Tax=Paragonimus heterotremus TaxID=100268 RepID=A0A8J4TDR2_9TREM|nr:Laminin beta 1 [Paragonimus heterotremus]
MYLERSYDFGRSWKRYAYFSNNCKRDFPTIYEGPRRTLTDVTCTGVYSQLTPSEGGVVAYMAAPSEMHADWPQYSKERMNLTAITNLRAVFTRLNTLGDMRVDDSLLTRRKYYYALFEWNVWGRCTCFGHAKRCKPKSSNEGIKPEKVYGVCECTHNTAGENCETCADFYWNKPWQPATKDSPNACERCECNEHATACFFNPLLYASSGNVSGGYCHGCMHNTEGVNCEYCKQNFYRHPSYPISHPSTCQPCNCHTDGTLYEGFCQQYTVPEQNTVAGRCLCKSNVGGDKCDRCKVGYWNFQANNPEGCQACTCNMMGTLDNGGCDPYTGLCTCKRFVGGANCDQCLEGYFNLTLAPLGCQECACSQLGSRNAICNRITGQCECKTGFTGRDCSQVEDGYFIRPPTEIIDRPGEKEITLDGPKGEGRFVIVLDVDPKQFGEGDKWTIIVKPYQHGATRCRNPSQTVNVYQDTSKIIISDVCLEAGLPIVLRIMPESQPSGPYTEILLTDIVLIPTDDSILARRCEVFREIAMDILSGRVEDRSGLPQECEVYFRLPRVSWRETGSVAERCMCNSTGSQTDICDKLTGQCPCKPGVVGRSCDRCAPYHYDFGAMGCVDCACNPKGSTSLQCNEATSFCTCHPGIVGKHCDMCKPGTWDFPLCRPCHCNGFSDICNQTTGVCQHCRENTGGANCEKCREGFYGDPLRGTPCKPCACPGGGVNHATECRMGPLQEQICYCKTGYTGPRCSECAMNYFGNPTEVGGSCIPCQCSGNIAMNEPGGCDPLTGRCLKCLHNSEGFNCETCKLGYWGDATRQMCQSCNCYPTGSVDEAKQGCNRQNGQCPCLPNVIGARCYECAPGYFNLTPGKGCEPCQCDGTGSLNDLCDPLTGQCQCKPDRSGRKCDQCRPLYYGDPHQADGCRPCNCDRVGASSDFCDPVSGQCPCRTGVAGRQCDRCDRGTEGTLPNCRPCGECWTNWDKAIDKVVSELDRLQNQTGRQLPAELKLLFNSLVELLDQIEHVPWMQMDDEKMDELQKLIGRTDALLQKINSFDSSPESVNTLSEKLFVDLDAESTRKRQITDLQDKLGKITKRLDEMLEEAGKTERLNPEGAWLAVQRASDFGKQVKMMQESIEYQRASMESNLNRVKAELNAVNSRGSTLNDDWAQLDRRIGEFRDQIRQTNRMLCGDNNLPPPEHVDSKLCPSNCGGAACDPVSRWLGLQSAALIRVLRSAEGGFPSKFVDQATDVHYETGLIGGCAVNEGCNASVGGRLRNLMEQNLELHTRLANAVQGVYRAEALISKVHSDRKEAEETVVNAMAELHDLKSRLETMYNLTDTLIKEVKNYTALYSELNKERFDQNLKSVQTTKLNVTFTEARQIVQTLEQRARELENRVQEVLKETEENRKISSDLVARAQNARDDAKNYMGQVKQLTEAERIYDDLAKHPIVTQADGKQIADQIFQVEKHVGGLNAEVPMFAQESSSQADLAKGASETAMKLLADANMARKETMDTLRELENIDIAYKQLEEKMEELDKLMSKLDSGDEPVEPSPDEEENGESIADPTKLMEQVQNFTAQLEKDTAEIKTIHLNLKKLDSQSDTLMKELNAYVEKFHKLSEHLSIHTKFHLTCK